MSQPHELARNHAVARLAHGQTIAKRHTRGTHRSLSLEESLERARRASRAAGVTRVANVTGLDRVGLPVIAVFRPNARSLVVSQGKGLDLSSAMVSGIMEAIESHHAEHVELPLRLASSSELQRRGTIADVARLPAVLGRVLPPDRAILWAEGFDLESDTPIWVPYELVHTNFSLPLPAGSGYFMMGSNGLASGNHMLEAISHGLCELIERDALALFAASGGVSQTQNRIDPASIDDPDAKRVLSMLEVAELAVGIWNITTDIEIATFLTVVVDREPNVFRQLYYATGSGTHPVREVALLRALTEAAQCRLTYIAGARDDSDREFFDRMRDPNRVEAMRRAIDQPLTAASDFGRAPSRACEALDGDVAWELECLWRVGLHQAIAVDLSRPEFEIPVVRVIVPGLESLSGAPGYVPGRRAREVAARTARGGAA
jgi:ribosomal protein S12 methylthiotransferase accessory factor